MDDTEEEELYPPSESTEQAWTWLRQHVEWAEGSWLVFVFTESPPQAHVLQRRLEGWYAEREQTQRILQPRSPDELQAALERLDDDTEAACTWLEAVCRDPLHFEDEGEPWTAAWEHVLLRANERRERLREQGKGLVLVARSALKPLFREAAPDLWSVHSKVLELGWSRDRSFEGEQATAYGEVIELLRGSLREMWHKVDATMPAFDGEEGQVRVSSIMEASSSVDDGMRSIEELAESRPSGVSKMFEYFFKFELALELVVAGRYDGAAKVFRSMLGLVPVTGGAVALVDSMTSVVDGFLALTLLCSGDYGGGELAARRGLSRAEFGGWPNEQRLWSVLWVSYGVLGRRYEQARLEDAGYVD